MYMFKVISGFDGFENGFFSKQENPRLVKSESDLRGQTELNHNIQSYLLKGRKHCGKTRKW